MRFAYIDSNGNEVPIPSVDALALRIELGAISDDTQLYDAAADQWGPADSHEIYHSLQRSAAEEEGFVAPPPAAPSPAPEIVQAEDDATRENGESNDPPSSLELSVAFGTEEPEDEVEPQVDFGDISSLTLAETPEEPEVPDSSSVFGDLPDLDLSFADHAGEALDPAPVEEEPESASLVPDAPLEEGEAPGFDFGEMAGGLELEDAFDDGPGVTAMTDQVDVASTDFAAFPEGGNDLDPAPDFSAGMELETAMEFDSGGFDGGDGGLDLEPPMTEFSPEDPPAWMDQDSEPDEEVLDFSAAGQEDPGAQRVSPRERGEPRSRPSPPRRRTERNLALPLIGVVALLAIGVGGYTFWPVLSDMIATQDEPDPPRVVMPDLAEALIPAMERAAEAAMARSFGNVVSAWSEVPRVDAPGSDWPGGAYLANASRYADVQEFWEGMSSLLDSARGIGLADFDAGLTLELSSEEIGEPEALAIRERADSGFVAAAPARQAIWDRFAVVVDASLALHDFVIANEDGLTYVPASSATTNPVLEVDASTTELSSALDDMLGAVVDALADLGFREVVTSEGLRNHLLNEIRVAAIQ